MVGYRFSAFRLLKIKGLWLVILLKSEQSLKGLMSDWVKTVRVPTAQGKQGKWSKKNLSGKTQGIWKFCQNTGNLVCSSCKFPDSKGKRYFDICHENYQLNSC